VILENLSQLIGLLFLSNSSAIVELRSLNLPVDLAQERCLFTIFLANLTPHALQVRTTDSRSENLKTEYGASAAGGALTLKSVTRTPKN